jgi:hypothetical protein
MTTQIELTESEAEALSQLAEQSGTSMDNLVHEAVKQLLSRQRSSDRLQLMRAARGIWKDRTDLPDFQRLRAEFDRPLA